ncbi:helix-turn-helix domain-containing protein [Paraburkholderia sp. EG287A]|uniref:helix-turn-helix domain-containing protein n=1 Tax=unclassified Paraburkholderia TaxID=2615204 RepID=UPI0034D29A4A
MIQNALFNPSRLTLARKRRGLTMIKLAAAVGVEPRSISAYEKGEFSPDGDRLTRLSSALGFPKVFFFGDDLDEPTPDIASFRALSKMTAGQRDTALGAGAIALMLNGWIEARFELPTPDLPDLSREDNPEAAALALRQQWGLGELPVKNMVHLLESKGVRVFSLSVDATEVDAFSMWRQRTPFVFLNTKKSAEHSRFDAAHELGHLVLHRHGSPQGREAEQQANAFASAFLMPKSSILTYAPRMATVDHLIELKKYWSVSVAALTYRLHAVGVLSDWHYQSLYIELSSRGYRKQEPNEGLRESSQILQKVFATLRNESISKVDIASDLCVPVEELDQLVFGLALTGLSGGGNNKARTGKPPQLRIVGSQGDVLE